jgi:GGDEF domain-containing protein
MLLPETNEMGALIVAERLRMELEGQIILPMTYPLTACFGVAMLLPGESRQELYARAGRAVEHSKRNGRNCVTMAGVISECDQLYGVAQQGIQGTDNDV